MKRPKFTLRNETRSGSERRRSKKAERNELASTRRQVIRDLGLATGAVAIGGAVATRLFPDDAQATVERASREATVAEIAKLTSNGRIAMGPLGSRNLGSAHKFLSGESVTARVPSAQRIASSTAYLLGRSSEGHYGFQATQRGFGLYAYAPDYGLDIMGVVTTQGGVLAHYQVKDRTNGDMYFTLWQGTHHDIHTDVPQSLKEAIDLFSGFEISDSVDGLSLTPKAGRMSGNSILETDLLLEFGDYIAEVRRVNDVSTPSWSGRSGPGGDFYSLGTDSTGRDQVLLVNDSVAVQISPWRRDSIGESDLDDIVSALIIDARSSSTPMPGSGGATGSVNDGPLSSGTGTSLGGPGLPTG